jgi:multimeric flavodoxin WrbA
MKCLILTSSPNKDGLTAECARAAAEGIQAAGSDSEIVCLNDRDVGLCAACNRGWGPCRSEHVCQVEDDFQELHALTNQADAYVVVSPVYFGELSESAKAFFDRLRRCEATRGDDSRLANKPAIGVAAAGGSGGGTVSCLDQMNRLFTHLRCTVYDLLTVTQKSRGHKSETIRRAARRMAERMGKSE